MTRRFYGRARNRFRLLSQMEGYCKNTGCLREYILRYFGDEAVLQRGAGEDAAGVGSGSDSGTGCGKLLKLSHGVCGGRCDCGCGGDRFVCGSTAPALWQNGYFRRGCTGRKTSVFVHAAWMKANGLWALATMSAVRIREVIDQLVGRGYLMVTQGQYPLLGLGSRARLRRCVPSAGNPMVGASGQEDVLGAAASAADARIRLPLPSSDVPVKVQRPDGCVRRSTCFVRKRRLTRVHALATTRNSSNACVRSGASWLPSVGCHLTLCATTLRCAGFVGRRPHSVDELLDVSGIW